MVTGRTVLLMKDKTKGPISSNFRPITCNKEAFESNFDERDYKHLHSEILCLMNKKGCTKSSRTSKDQLLIDCAILKEAKIRHKNLEMIWMD